MNKYEILIFEYGNVRKSIISRNDPVEAIQSLGIPYNSVLSVKLIGTSSEADERG